MMIVAELGAGDGDGDGDGLGVGLAVAEGDGVGVGVALGAAYDGARTPEPAAAAINPVTTANRCQAPVDTSGVSHEREGARCRLDELPRNVRGDADAQRVRITDEPWPNRPWFAVIPTRAPSTCRAPA